MHKILTITLAIFLTACVSTPKSTINVKDNYLKKPNEILLTLVGVNGKLFEETITEPGSYLFQVERLESLKGEKAQQSFHTMRVKLEDNSNYQLMTKEENGYIYVWLEDIKSKKIVSTVSALSDFDVPEITLNAPMETIAISGQRISRLDKIGTNPCSFKYTVSDMNHGFEGSITDKKLPTRYNRPRC